MKMAEATTTGGVALPYNLEAEQSVLGCILLNSGCMEEVLMHLKAESFYLPQHRAIFGAMLSMYTSSQANIDPVLIADVLAKEGHYDVAGGREYLVQLANSVPSTANVASYAKIVKEQFYLRTLIQTAREIMDDAASGEGDASSILDAAEQKIYDIRQGKDTGGPTKVSEVIVNGVYDRLGKLTGEDKEKYKGIPTGFGLLDTYITGLNKSDFILIGARPAMGKTSFALNLASNVSMMARKKCVFFSLEMTKEQLAERLLASQAGVPSHKLRTGELDNDALACRSGAFLLMGQFRKEPALAGENMAEQNTRPQRVRLPDFAGRAVSLPDGPEAWICRGEGDAVLLLGLGPESGANLPQVLPLIANAPAVYWLESPQVTRALEAWRLEAEILPREPLPAHWRVVTAEQAVALAGQCRYCIYSPGLRLDPEFWGPLLGRVDAALAFPSSAARASGPMTAEDKGSVRKAGPVLLPGNDGQLLHQELRTALAGCGFGPVVDALPQPSSGMGGAQAGREDEFLARWRTLLHGGKPAFLLSVNMRGLDADGRV